MLLLGDVSSATVPAVSHLNEASFSFLRINILVIISVSFWTGISVSIRALCASENKTGLSIDKLKRCITYFYTRGIKFCEYETETIQINAKQLKIDRVKQVVQEMFDQETTITVNLVAEQLKVSVNTIRNWGCCPYISRMKRCQFEKRVLMEKENIYGFVDEYLRKRELIKVFSSQLYKDLQKSRNLLWRNAPN